MEPRPPICLAIHLIGGRIKCLILLLCIHDDRIIVSSIELSADIPVYHLERKALGFSHGEHQFNTITSSLPTTIEVSGFVCVPVVFKSYNRLPLHDAELGDLIVGVDFRVPHCQYSVLPDIIAYTEINGNRYFTTTEILKKSDIWVIDPNGIHYMLQRYNNKYDLVIIYVNAGRAAGAARAEARGQNVEAYNSRYDSEDGQFSAFENDMPWRYHILNLGTIEEGADKLEYIIRKECCLREVEDVQVEYTNPAMLPLSEDGDSKSAWIGLRAAEDVDMKAGDHRLISLGVRVKLPDGYEAHIAPCRSTFADFGIIQTDSPLIIDNSHHNDQVVDRL